MVLGGKPSLTESLNFLSYVGILTFLIEPLGVFKYSDFQENGRQGETLLDKCKATLLLPKRDHTTCSFHTLPFLAGLIDISATKPKCSRVLRGKLLAHFNPV